MLEIDQYLRATLEQGGSDLHIGVGTMPKIRVSGNLIPFGSRPMATRELVELLRPVVGEERWARFEHSGDLDFAYEIPELARFRGNFFQSHWGLCAVFRQIPVEVLSFEKLQLPEILRLVCEYREGLVLVTGPTGSGKSTTLAAMIDLINRTQRRHIITLEDPIEFVHSHKNSVIVQREIGQDCDSFARGIKSAMRADPDIVLVGEMRDIETIRMALSCASMGILVFATLHTNNAPKTIDRIIDAFPAREQTQVRVMLAESLSCVVSQLLCKRADKGRVAVHEILLKHEALPNAIRTGKSSTIRAIIESNTARGMQLMDNSIRKVLNDGLITPEEAYMKASDKDAFQHLLPK